MEFSLWQFKKAIEGSGVLLGLDLGTKTIGLALSDDNQTFATPFKTITRVKFTQDVAVLQKIIADQNVNGLILGLPLNMDDSEGKRAQSTRSFARNFLKIHDIPLAFQDERLSTFEARDRLAEAGLSSDKTHLDAHAAAIILQGALDALRAL